MKVFRDAVGNTSKNWTCYDCGREYNAADLETGPFVCQCHGRGTVVVETVPLTENPPPTGQNKLIGDQ
jgi:hypothetical protein